MKGLRGVLTAIVTPFREDGAVDVAALRALVRWQIDEGIDGLVPCGTTGEGATLTPDEHALVIRTVVEEAAGKVPVVAGCGTNDTRTTVAGAARAVAAGADALLVVTPYYNKPNRSGILAHYRAVAESVSVPIVPYNVPGRTGQNLGAPLILELASVPGIAGVKEAAGSVEQAGEILAGRPPGFAVLSGDDALALAELALGADGLISVVSNEAPGPMSAMARAVAAGDLAAAREIHYRLLPLMRANFVETNPVPVKVALAALGRCREATRLPLGTAERSTRETIARALDAAGMAAATR